MNTLRDLFFPPCCGISLASVHPLSVPIFLLIVENLSPLGQEQVRLPFSGFSNPPPSRIFFLVSSFVETGHFFGNTILPYPSFLSTTFPPAQFAVTFRRAMTPFSSLFFSYAEKANVVDG